MTKTFTFFLLAAVAVFAISIQGESGENGETYSQVTDADIAKREINRDVKDFPADTDRSTPEGAFVLWSRNVIAESDPQKAFNQFNELAADFISYGGSLSGAHLSDFENRPQSYRDRADASLLFALSYGESCARLVSQLHAPNQAKPILCHNFMKTPSGWTWWGSLQFETIEEAQRQFSEWVDCLKMTDTVDFFQLGKQESAWRTMMAEKLLEAGISPQDVSFWRPLIRVGNAEAVMNLRWPNSVYVSYMLLVACEKDAKQARENFLALDNVAAHGGAEQFKESDFAYDEAWAQVCRNAVLREEIVYRDQYAGVIAFLPGESVVRPFDLRTFEKVEEKWLNIGNGRFETLDEARDALIENFILPTLLLRQKKRI